MGGENKPKTTEGNGKKTEEIEVNRVTIELRDGPRLNVSTNLKRDKTVDLRPLFLHSFSISTHRRKKYTYFMYTRRSGKPGTLAGCQPVDQPTVKHGPA